MAKKFLKTLPVLAILLLLSFTSFAQDDLTSVGRVHKIRGVEVYILSEPLRDYDVTGEVSGENLASAMGAVATAFTNDASQKKCYSISEKIDMMVSNALKVKNHRKEHKRIDFDALIITDSDLATCIKFTN
jgi:hypothetical protein